MNAIAVRRTSDERREEILEAAFTAFSETGFEGTSTDDIAAAVGISQPYLFRLFGTKKELFLAAVERCFEETEDVSRGRRGGRRRATPSNASATPTST